jgi:hypothetical protein
MFHCPKIITSLDKIMKVFLDPLRVRRRVIRNKCKNKRSRIPSPTLATY